MSIRSRLFATVALPVLSASLMIQPAFADSLTAPFEVAQEGEGQPSPEELLLKRKQRQAEEESQGQAEEQQPQAEEQQTPRKKRQQQAEEQPAAEESAPQQAEEEAPRRKKRQQQAEEQPAAEESAPQQAEEEAPRRKKRQQQAEEQPAAEESAPQQAEEEAPRRKKRQQQAEEQPAAEESAPQQAEEEAPRRKKRQQQAEEQPAAEESAPQQAEEEAPARKKRQQQAEEQQPAAEEGAPQQAEEQEPTRKRRQQQAEEQQQTDEQRAAEQPGAEPEGGTTAEQPATEAPAEQTGEGEQQPVPGAEPPATAEQQGEQPAGQPAPEVVDERSTEERQKIAEDPAASDDTVVLPVERGAAVLDSDKDADIAGGNQSRETRRKQREELRAKQESVEVPTDDASAQAAIPAEAREEIPQKIEAVLSEEGERVEEAPTFTVPQTTNIINNTVINNTVNNTTVNNTTENNVTEVRVVEEVDDRVILGVGDRIFVRGDDRPRLRRNSEESFYETLPRGRVRETIVRPGGYRIVTIYNEYGDILTRTRVDRGGEEYVMMYAPEYEEDRPTIVDVGYDLPPMRLSIPVDEYIVDVAEDPDRDYYEFLSEPPVEPVERVYTIDEVRHSARLRDKVRRIDLDTITFATGSAEVSMSQAKTMRNVAEAMNKVLEKDPGETFFIEGHTDAVGADQSNLVLSDERAESVAVLLTEVYGIPAENLVTQGYGERFLKIRTDGPEQENRRVTIRRVTPLVRPVAQR
ncbi:MULTISPECIES: OmpA family protein [Sinorhizobium]|uniref:OmpA family protein n=1 Tax=Sinorhizobium kummerowiae TaxID=158892 RepID=A0ABY8TAW6_9HYPH|nr:MULTISPECIES: OmpA family protein [Sinorhizobium]QND26961.1 OmpA family protein [Sinorhizobium meliloti]WHS94404.1 OmpA family protein [Sinorhizobium kummerowiae]WQO40151.1 OmpA family protein [Sinorhizobium meliloti]WQO80572.1 OmpA family protein [Sinorhizobium meliloti]WQP12388.1 OmpA family protein [Sinorhizobium meliloti]